MNGAFTYKPAESYPEGNHPILLRQKDRFIVEFIAECRNLNTKPNDVENLPKLVFDLLTSTPQGSTIGVRSSGGNVRFSLYGSTAMPQHLIELSASDHSVRGDFRAQVSQSKVFVPQDIKSLLDKMSVRTAEDFVSLIDSFPSVIAEQLGWEFEEVTTARVALIQKLRGVIEDAYLQPLSTPPRRCGALDPNTLPKALHPKP